jgi:hypothetical protein
MSKIVLHELFISYLMLSHSGDEPKLMFANRHELREIAVRSGDYRQVLRGLQRAVAFDYDYGSGAIFWSDVAARKIFRCVTSRCILVQVCSHSAS